MTVYRTPPERAAVHPAGWARLSPGVSVTRLPLIDIETGLFARLAYRDAEMVAERVGGRLPTREEILTLVRVGHIIPPVTLSHGPEMVTRAHAETHDRRVREHLSTTKWDGKKPVMNVGKHWRFGAKGENVAICGWWDGSKLIQSGLARDNPHHLGEARSYHDYGTTTIVVSDGETDPPPTDPPPTERTMRRTTIRLGSTGPDVIAWQRGIGATPDGRFGPKTDEATRQWQRRHGLVDDGIVGERSWRTLGEDWEPPAPASAGVGPAPACLAAIRDANARWPNRRRTSDGIMGDARHQAAGVSGHNAGNAVDVSHDPAHGCDGELIARLALRDQRTAYVIWNRRIWNTQAPWRDAPDGPGRAYTGSNPHTIHVHVEIRPEMRHDASPWAWAPKESS